MKNKMYMLKYVLKRLALMAFTFCIIVTICFMLVRLLPRELPNDKVQAAAIAARWEALGYNEPLLIQFGIYLKNIFTAGDFGTSWYIQMRKPAMELITSRLLPTVLVNVYSLLISIPFGLMVFISVPSYVYAFMLQYFLYFKLGWLPLQVYSLADAGGSWFTWKMFHSMVAPVLALSFGSIATLCRFTRAELTETLTSDYMLLARTKGLTRAQATSRHAFKNAMVPILPMILSSFVGVLGGSFVIEQIFAIPGVGQLYLQSITLFDYDVFMADTIFYVLIGLLAGIVVDISYGFIDPRIRMGEK